VSETNPTPDQKFEEALTAMSVAVRVFVRALLVAAGALVGRAAGALSPELERAIDGLFIGYRNLTAEGLALHTAITVEVQRRQEQHEDRIGALEQWVGLARMTSEEERYRHE
jgi:hypothetical protein